MNTFYVLGVLRAILSALGGGLVGSGVLNQDQVEPMVGGLLIFFTAIWSIVEKKWFHTPKS
jgi:hypothetical protein